MSLVKVWNAVLHQVWSFAVVAVMESWASMGNCLGMSSWIMCFKILFDYGQIYSKSSAFWEQNNLLSLRVCYFIHCPGPLLSCQMPVFVPWILMMGLLCIQGVQLRV